MTKLRELTDILNNLYPPEYAESWDKVGLHFGDYNSTVNKVMTSLDVRPDVVKEAIDKRVDTLIVHHPVIFQPIERFDNSTPDIRMYADLIRNHINVFAMHTNLDRAWDGMNDWLAQSLNLRNIVSLQLVAEDNIPGLGRFGQLPQAMTRSELLQHIKEKLNSPHLKIMEKEEKATYRSIAITGGASFASIYDALSLDADVFITGDLTYHKGHDAEELDILTVDAGHHIEQIFIPKMAQYLQEIVERNNWDVEILQSETNTNPFIYY